MPQISVAENPTLAKQILKDIAMSEPRSQPDLRGPVDPVFSLCGGYQQGDGKWTSEFEVRELTGRDEEYLGRITEPTRVFIAMIERGLVRIGTDRSSPEVVDGVLAGDWETILTAVRVVTFGETIETNPVCKSCIEEYVSIIDLKTALPFKTITRDQCLFDITGRHGTKYGVCLPYGSTQRRVMGMGVNPTQAEVNTIILGDCVQAINGVPLMGVDQTRDIPLADRRLIIREIEARRVGPRFQEVMTQCPACGAEQESSLSIAALFQ